MWGNSAAGSEGALQVLWPSPPPSSEIWPVQLGPGRPTLYLLPSLHPPTMSLLQLAHEERLAHRPRSINSCYAGPVNPTYGQLPGWVADLTRSTYPTYARGR